MDKKEALRKSISAEWRKAIGPKRAPSRDLVQKIVRGLSEEHEITVDEEIVMNDLIRVTSRYLVFKVTRSRDSMPTITELRKRVDNLSFLLEAAIFQAEDYWVAAELAQLVPVDQVRVGTEQLPVRPWFSSPLEQRLDIVEKLQQTLRAQRSKIVYYPGSKRATKHTRRTRTEARDMQLVPDLVRCMRGWGLELGDCSELVRDTAWDIVCWYLKDRGLRVPARKRSKSGGDDRLWRAITKAFQQPLPPGGGSLDE